MRHILKIFVSAVIIASIVLSNLSTVMSTLSDQSLYVGINDNTLDDLPSFSQRQKMVALTFDDGPGPYTAQLLDELKERGAKATFFLFGKKLTSENASLVRRMAEDGHCIGSHTYSHARLTSLTNSQIYKELKMADEAIAQITGIVPDLLRPPYGSYNKRIIDACSKPLILWSLDTRDWQLHDSKTVCKNIINTVKDGDIILLHELERSSKDGVISAIDIMIDEGYCFVTVPELFEKRGIDLVCGKRYYSACIDIKSEKDNPDTKGSEK